MAERKRKVPGPDGELHDASVVGFNPVVEHWTEVMCDDGTVLKMKLVVTDVYRFDGLKDADGFPIYTVRSQNILRVDSPENLKEE